MASAIPLIAGLGGGALSGFFAPEGQDIESFQGRAAPITLPDGTVQNFPTDPNRNLAYGLGLNNFLINQAFQRSQQPVTQANTLPSAFVQQPATFSGGGLPMDIGTTGFDLANPFWEPTPPPGGFGFDIDALINQIINGPAGPPGPGPGGGGGGPIGPAGGPAPPGGNPIDEPRERFDGPPPLPPIGNAPPLPPIPREIPYDPPPGGGEPPPGTPPVGGPGPPGDRDRPRDDPRVPPGDNPGRPPRQRPPRGDVGTEPPQYGGPPWDLPPLGQSTSQQTPTMQDALSMLGFDMNSILRRT